MLQRANSDKNLSNMQVLSKDALSGAAQEEQEEEEMLVVLPASVSGLAVRSGRNPTLPARARRREPSKAQPVPGFRRTPGRGANKKRTVKPRPRSPRGGSGRRLGSDPWLHATQ